MVSTYRRPIFQLNQISNKMVHFKTTKYKKKCISLVILKIPFIFSYNFNYGSIKDYLSYLNFNSIIFLYILNLPLIQGKYKVLSFISISLNTEF